MRTPDYFASYRTYWYVITTRLLRDWVMQRYASIIPASVYGIVGAADSPPYHASKGAVRIMSNELLNAPIYPALTPSYTA